MGTKILRPQDCLAEIIRFRISPASFHHRRDYYTYTGNNLYGYRYPAELRTDQIKKPHHQNMPNNPTRLLTRSVDFTTVSKNTQNMNNDFSMGKITILRRGQSLDSLNNKDAMYAGSAFSVSPPPSDLPLPTFSKKLSFDDHATRDLRRLLRLE